MKHSRFSSSSSIFFILTLLFFPPSIAAAPIAMSESSSAKATVPVHEVESPASVHIVYMETPEEEEEHRQNLEAYHIRTLASVLGSEEAAKDALIYSYDTAASGFSAKLTSKQVDQISKLPDVLQVVPSMTYQLDCRQSMGHDNVSALYSSSLLRHLLNTLSHSVG